ncbi:MAG: hypothetical protein ACOC1F_04955 [Myxococcota bacterium]
MHPPQRAGSRDAGSGGAEGLEDRPDVLGHALHRDLVPGAAEDQMVDVALVGGELVARLVGRAGALGTEPVEAISTSRMWPVPPGTLDDGSVVAVRTWQVPMMRAANSPRWAEGPFLLGARESLEYAQAASEARQSRAITVQLLSALFFLGIGLFHIAYGEGEETSVCSCGTA